jgi:hypothetical protein
LQKSTDQANATVNTSSLQQPLSAVGWTDRELAAVAIIAVGLEHLSGKRWGEA